MLSFVIDKLDSSYFSFCLLRCAKELDAIIFYSDIGKTKYNILSPMFPIKFLQSNKNKLICCEKSLINNCLTLNSDIYYYCWTPEWLSDKEATYNHYSNIYNNSRVNILTRSEEYAEIIKNTWNQQKITQIGDFENEKLKRIA